MNSLERLARERFASWAAYRKFTRCWDCCERRYCGASRRSGPFLCIDCFDLRGAS